MCILNKEHFKIKINYTYMMFTALQKLAKKNKYDVFCAIFEPVDLFNTRCSLSWAHSMNR